MEVPIIKEIVIIFTLSIAVLLVCHRLRLPPVVGFLATGVLCGPHGLKLVSAVHDVENLATIGVVLLLFTVGMEFSFKNIVKYRNYFFGGGALQAAGTFFLTLGICCLALDRPFIEGVFLGFIITLSSTAIVLRVLDGRGETETNYGRLVTGILIFQDFIAVFMMLLVPVLLGHKENFDLQHMYDFAKGLTLLFITALIAFRGVPKLLYYVTRTRNRELFLLSILTICFAVAWVTSSIGLSLSLGAFLAGLVVSESDYSDEAVGNVLPFQTIFTSFFFISMGMLLDLSFVVHQPLTILAIAGAVLLLKFLVAGGTGIILGMPLRPAILSGVALCQIGEFSLVIAYSGMSEGLATEYQYQMILAVSLLTMAVTPTLMAIAPTLAHLVEKLPMPKRLRGGLYQAQDTHSHHIEGHLIIVGFGLRGRHLARAAKEAKIPYLILETNPDTVKTEKRKGEPIQYGDPSHHTVLAHAGIRHAHSIVIVINDPVSTQRIVKAARELNPNVYIISRTCYVHEVQKLFQCGANDVVPDEFGSSLEIFTRVLLNCGLAQEEVSRCVNALRTEGYEALRLKNLNPLNIASMPFAPSEARVETMRVSKNSTLVGQTIVQSALKKVHGLTVLLIKRHNKTLMSIEADTTLEAADEVVVIGSPSNLDKAKQVFQAGT